MSRGLGRVDIFTTTAIKLDRFFVRNITKTDEQKRLRLAQDSRTSPEIYPLEFFKLEGIRLELERRIEYIPFLQDRAP